MLANRFRKGESSKNMSIDSISDTSIDIKDLVITEPKKTFDIPFDMHRDLTEQQLLGVKGTTNRAFNKLKYMHIADANANGSGSLHRHLRGILIAAPEMVKPLMDEESYTAFSSQMEAWDPERTSEEAMYSYMQKATFMHYAAPEGALHGSVLTGYQWDHILAYFQRLQFQPEDPEFNAMIEIASEVRLLAPEKTHLFQLPDEAWEYAKEKVENEVKKLNEDNYNPAALNELITELKLLHPEKIKHLSISESEWEKMWEINKHFASFWVDTDDLRKDTSFAGQFLGDIAMMRADKIVVGSNNIALQYERPEALDTADSQMPETRRF